MKNNRFKNYVLWLAVASLIGMGLIDAEILDNLNQYDKYVEQILYILVLVGIVNNPSNSKGLKD